MCWQQSLTSSVPIGIWFKSQSHAKMIRPAWYNGTRYGAVKSSPFTAALFFTHAICDVTSCVKFWLVAEVYWTEAVERSKGRETDLVLMTCLLMDGIHQATMLSRRKRLPGCMCWLFRKGAHFSNIVAKMANSVLCRVIMLPPFTLLSK